MVLKKKYFIWKIFKENDKFYSHPNTILEKKEKWADKIKLVEYGYEQNGWYLGHIEWDNDIVTAQQIVEHAEDFSKFNFQVKTPEEVLTLLKQFYPEDQEYFSLDTDGFTIIDNRPIDEDMI